MAISFRRFREPKQTPRSPRLYSCPIAPSTLWRSNTSPPKSRNPVMAHVITSPQTPWRREKTKTLRPEGPRALTGSAITLSRCLGFFPSLPTPLPSSDDSSSLRAALYHEKRQEQHDRQPPYVEALYLIPISVQAKSPGQIARYTADGPCWSTNTEKFHRRPNESRASRPIKTVQMQGGK